MTNHLHQEDGNAGTSSDCEERIFPKGAKDENDSLFPL